MQVFLYLKPSASTLILLPMYGTAFLINGIPFILQRTLIAASLGCLVIFKTSTDSSDIQLNISNLRPLIWLL